ncbi:MAG: zf-HC2 domain-containing protein, partial [Chloroflexota bacterium]|nr:zf-HC2 domain-containing protein [Chloroflexota bacterium]
MTCARYRALISRYLDDELTARQRTELLDHLTGCANCSADLARLRLGEVLLRKLPEPPPPPPALGSNVQREVRAIRQRRRRDPRWWLAAGGRLPARTALLGWTVLLLLPLAVTLLPR